MQFTSLIFFGFFIIFYLLYVIFRGHIRVQNIWLLIASYVFYGLIGWRFLLVMVLITLTDFSLGWLMGNINSTDQKRIWFRRFTLLISLCIDAGILAFFKYYGYFAEDFSKVLDYLKLHPDPAILNFLVPVGISFYALKSMSYTLDIYRGKQNPASNLLEYAIYIAFFPALLAGPIDRAGKLLPQIHQNRFITPNHFSAGIFLILWGYFKKLVIADNLAVISYQVFQPETDLYGLAILFGILAFSIQIYADFSGYTDIARGFARLMGFDLAINFKLPYFAINPADFWQRWHISLSEWLRDYIFFPVRRFILNHMHYGMEFMGLLLPPIITMLISGMWHGTGWNFILWGLYHGVLLIIYRLSAMISLPQNILRFSNSNLGFMLKMGLMFFFTCLGWVFFRAETVQQAFQILANISLAPSEQSESFLRDILFYSSPLLIMQLWQAIKGDLLVVTKQRFSAQLLVHSLLLVWIVIFGARQTTEFIYSQF